MKMRKKSKLEWAEQFQEMLQNYIDEYPDTDFVFFVNTIPSEQDEQMFYESTEENEIEDGTMSSIMVYDDSVFDGILNFLASEYSATERMPIDFPEDAHNIKYWEEGAGKYRLN